MLNIHKKKKSFITVWQPFLQKKETRNHKKGLRKVVDIMLFPGSYQCQFFQEICNNIVSFLEYLYVKEGGRWLR